MEFEAKSQPAYLRFGDINLHVSTCKSLNVERGDRVEISSGDSKIREEVKPVEGGTETSVSESVFLPPDLMEELGVEVGDSVRVGSVSEDEVI